MGFNNKNYLHRLLWDNDLFLFDVSSSPNISYDKIIDEQIVRHVST